MIRLAPFEFHAPASIAEALNLLARNDGDAKILAGGTDLLVGMKQAVTRPRHVVSLGGVRELQQCSVTENHGMRIGAMCRLGDIEQHPLVRHLLPSLTTAISSIASPQIRNRATIGGNLCLNTRCFYFDQSEFWRGSLGYCLKHGSGICHAAPGLKHCSAVLSSDLAPLLMALDASITIAGSTGLRTVPLSQLYTDDGMSPNSLGRGELLAEIIIPPQVANARTAFKKLRRRRSIDYPLVNVGTTAVVGADNVVRTIRIIVGAVQSMPVELHASETILLGHRLTLDQIDRAAEAAAGHVKPLPNAIEPVLYRKVMVKRIVKEALLDLVA